MTRKTWADKGSRHARGYNSRWDRIRQEALKRDRYLCQACLKQGMLTPLCIRKGDHAVDHIKPKVQGGTDDMGNLQSLCIDCHTAKTAQDEGWKQPRKVGLDGYPC